MNEIRRGSDPKFHLGINGPRARAHPKLTSMNSGKGMMLNCTWGRMSPGYPEVPGRSLKANA
eukprot:530102-Karenia_brevis.AAC.1